MSFTVYGNHERVPGEFSHRGIPIVVFQFDKGALHCEKWHDYRSKKCGVCDQAISAKKTCIAFVGGDQASTDCATADEAVKAAALLIDYRTGEGIGPGKDREKSSFDPRKHGSAMASRERILSGMKALNFGRKAQAMLKTMAPSPKPKKKKS